MNTVSVILPTFNESENIGPLIESICTNVKNLKEIIISDDDSPDGTIDTAKQWAKKNKKTDCIVTIRRTRDHGLCQSISEGILKASGDIIVWMDADFSHPPEVINALTREVQHGHDIAVASRYIPGGKTKETKGSSELWYTIWISTIANRLMRLLFGVSFYDFTSGFIAVKRTVIQKLPLRGSYGEYFIDFIIRAFRNGYSIIEIPFTSKPRAYGESKTVTNLPMLVRRCYQYGTVVLKLAWETHTLKKT